MQNQSTVEQDFTAKDPATLPVVCTNDLELLRLIQLWPTLPDPIRAAMMALVNTASPPSTPRPIRETVDDSMNPGAERAAQR